MATLARTNSPNALLEQVAAQVDMIEERNEQQNISACVQILAGLRFEKDLIRQLFREEIMQESVIYQDILLKGEQRGEQRGEQKGEVAVILRQLARRLGNIQPQVQQIRALSITQLEELAEALLDFKSQNDLVNYLASISSPQPNRQEK